MYCVSFSDTYNRIILTEICKHPGNVLYFACLNRSYTLEDIFVLLVYVYSLADSSVLDDPEKERNLMVSKSKFYNILVNEVFANIK